MFSLLNIHKPKGLTSHDVVARVRRVFGLKKVGHMGTLDPLAEGVLPICLGHATRLIEYFPTDKRYTAEVMLGKTTTTLDAEGEVVSETSCIGLDVSFERIQSVLKQFTGVIQQQVPLYSAVHVKGKKLYELARQGKTADLPVREATIYELDLLGISRVEEAHPILTLDIHCGSGTYIRSLARDIGDALGCGAYMSDLTRTMHGKFHLRDSVDLEILMQCENPTQYLQDPRAFLGIPLLEIKTDEQQRLLSNGMKIEAASVENDSTLAVKLKPNAFYMAIFKGKPVGVIQMVEQKFKPIKIFHL